MKRRGTWSYREILLRRMHRPWQNHIWPTELEVAGLVWAIRKIRHLFDNSPLATIVYTDHSATVGIVK